MNDTPTTSPTAPSAGAVRAALATFPEDIRLHYADRYLYAELMVNERAAIIDRETRAKEMLAALKQLNDDAWPMHVVACKSCQTDPMPDIACFADARREIDFAEGRA